MSEVRQTGSVDTEKLKRLIQEAVGTGSRQAFCDRVRQQTGINVYASTAQLFRRGQSGIGVPILWALSVGLNLTMEELVITAKPNNRAQGRSAVTEDVFN